MNKNSGQSIDTNNKSKHWQEYLNSTRMESKTNKLREYLTVNHYINKYIITPAMISDSMVKHAI